MILFLWLVSYHLNDINIFNIYQFILITELYTIQIELLY